MSTYGSVTYWPLSSVLLDDLLGIKGITAGLCIVILLSFYSYSHSKESNGVRLPTYILLEGYAIGQMLMGVSWLRRLADTLFRHGSSSLYGLTSTHRIVSSPGLASSVLRRPLHLLHNDPTQWRLTAWVFGAPDHMRKTMDTIQEELFTAVSKNLLQETRARGVAQDTYKLLRSLVPTITTAPAPWLVNTRNVSYQDGSTDADLYELVRDYTTHISIRMLAGSDFLTTNPAFPTDLFTFDAGFALLALGLPTWTPLPLIKKAVAARKRMVAQVQAFAERLEAVATGAASSDLQARLADVNGVFWDRAAAYQRVGLPMPVRGNSDLAMFWAMNANTSPFVFWVIAYLYADPELLARVRAEIDPLMSVVSTRPNGSQQAFLVESLDADGILTRSPVLKATYLESFRLAHEPSSLRYVEEGFSVVDPALSKDAPPMQLQKGTFITVPHTVQQYDSRIYADPNEFRADRFLSEKDGEVKAGYGTLKPWGDGGSMCKGRVFAEREILVTVATIVRCWDMEAVDGRWKVPGKIPGTGVMKPSTKLRVRIRPRS